MKHSLKKLAFLASSSLACFLVSQNAQAASGYGSAGCGLGSMLIGDDNTWWKQVFAGTTNGTSANQTFAMTSGTSNCPSGITGHKQAQKDFVITNLASLQREAAQGSGETITGLASVMGCSQADYAQFGAYTQSHYEQIFNSKQADTVLSNLRSEVSKNSDLGSKCTLVNI